MGAVYATAPAAGELPLPAGSRVETLDGGQLHDAERVAFDGAGPEGRATVRFRPPDTTGRGGAGHEAAPVEVVAAVRLVPPPAPARESAPESSPAPGEPKKPRK